jgi:hypothetical protein
MMDKTGKSWTTSPFFFFFFLLTSPVPNWSEAGSSVPGIATFMMQRRRSGGMKVAMRTTLEAA